MNNQNKENENFILARETAQKFDFYFLALVFTILGLSVQTSFFVQRYHQYIFEIVALFSLLVSGLAGLFRIEWMSVAYRHYGTIQEDQKKVDMLNQGLKGKPILSPSGKQFSDDELLKEKEKLNGFILKRQTTSKAIDRRTSIKYYVHKYMFVIGIIALVISRVILKM